MKTKIFVQIVVIIGLVLGAVFVGAKILTIGPPQPADEHGHGSGGGHEHGPHAGHGEGDAHGGHGAHGEGEEVPRGPNGGRLLSEGDFALEITIYEPPGTEPQFRVYPYEKGKPIDPAGIELTVELHRINRIDIIAFKNEGTFLAGEAPVVEPHSFEVKLSAERGGKTLEWEYDSFEGRVEIPVESAKNAGIIVETAGPAKLHVRVPLNGKIGPNEEQMTHVIPRFPGVLKQVEKRLGDRVEKGDVLALVESNESNL
jgi:membrane fusion protein, heavy metal efflux system